jgi:magnesium-transporting ATPase (P-type)
MSGSKVLEGFGRLLVLAVGPNSQQGLIQSMVLHGSSAAAGGGADGSSSSGSAAAVPMLREATPLTSRLEDVANSIGGVGLAAALGVLAVNSGLYTAEVLGAGGSLWSSASLEVRRQAGGAAGCVCRVGDCRAAGSTSRCWHRPCK